MGGARTVQREGREHNNRMRYWGKVVRTWLSGKISIWVQRAKWLVDATQKGEVTVIPPDSD